MASGDLTYRQRLFVEAYLGKANGNATEAARVAGYSHPNQQGPRLLVNVGIRVAIDAKLAGAAMSANEVLARMSAIASADLSDFIRIGKHGDPSLDMAKARKLKRLGLAKKLSPTKDGWTIELHDAHAALVQLGKYHGLWDGDKVSAPSEGRPRMRPKTHDGRHDPEPETDPGP